MRNIVGRVFIGLVVVDLGCGAPANRGPTDAGPTPQWLLPVTGIAAAQLGVLVNSQDPQSVSVAQAYAQKRGLPAQNIVTLSFPVTDVMTVADYVTARASLDAQLDGGAAIEAFALSWTRPYRVDCMSATTAFAVGYDTKYCNTTTATCGDTAPVATFDSATHLPWEDFGIRPAMMLAAGDAGTAMALIDRGVASDDTFPTGDVYLVRTSDAKRSARYLDFQATEAEWADAGLRVTYVDNAADGGTETITNTAGVFGYMTGLVTVPGITTNQYLPGAYADHLTSFGGMVPVSSQMSVVDWLSAGATASYGTVVEPCAYTTKFPQASVLWRHYYGGEPIVEALWKSVAWPGEGNFVGEPLARPFGKQATSYDATTRTLSLTATWFEPGVRYAIDGAPSAAGPWTEALSGLMVSQRARTTFQVQPATQAFYRIVPR